MQEPGLTRPRVPRRHGRGAWGSRWRRAIFVALWVCVLGATTHTHSASAAFPGRDGLIATDDSDGACTGSCADAGGPGNTVSTVNPHSGRVSRVTSGSLDAQAFAPRWSPSGTLLAFVQFAFPMGSQVLAVSNPTGGELKTIPLPAGLGAPSDPAFTADGAHLLFVDSDTRGYDIFRVALDGSGLTRVTNLSAPSALATPVESSRGRIAFVRGRSIYLLDPAGHPMLLHQGAKPDFSPGGNRIVFEEPSRRLVETIGIDGHGLRRVRRIPPADVCGRDRGAGPVYSPSGRFIAFTRSGNCGQPPDALIVIHANGTHPRVVLKGDPVQDPNWQPIPISP
jgi:Tol biopolymer transport system component